MATKNAFCLTDFSEKNSKKGERFISVIILVGALFLPPHLTFSLPTQINHWLQMYHDKRTPF